jgi:K+-sensing histidine kinase KdpD
MPATLRTVTRHPRRLLTPIPLEARASVGRGAAGVMAVLVLLGGILAATTGGDDVSLPRWLLLVVVSGGTVVYVVVAITKWDARLSERAQEALLAASVALPSVLAVIAYLADEPDDPDALFFLAAIVAAGALTVPLRWYAAGVTALLATVAATAGARGALRDVAFVLVVTLATAMLAALAANVLARTIATGTAREREAEMANRALMAVVDAARTATTSDAQDVLDAVVGATERLASDTAGVYLLHPDGKLRYGAVHNIPEHLHDEVFPRDRGMAGRALQTDRTIVTNDYLEDDNAMSAYREVGLRAAIASPIRVHGEPVGVLVAGRYRPGGYQQAAVTAFELLADHAGRALALSQAIDEDRQMLEQLKSLHALQEDFVATVSHELRTPLTVIDGLAETIERRHQDLAPEQVDQLLSRLRANTTTLSTIVTSLLDAARLDRGLVEVDQQVVDLWALVEGCVARLSPILPEHVLELELSDAEVLADGALLERVVDNLLTNAQRHTPPGTTVRITTEVDVTDCVVTISDDGPGIPAEDLARITERFTRGGDLHTRGTRGLGLGLALADQVLRLHGTRLHVSSPPGTGAQFRFKLRLAGCGGD